MEASETRANSTIGIDGGLIGPITAVAAVSAAAKLGAYLPSFVIMFCIILPVPAASAMAAPDMPAKMTLWRMCTRVSPGRNIVGVGTQCVSKGLYRWATYNEEN